MHGDEMGCQDVESRVPRAQAPMMEWTRETRLSMRAGQPPATAREI
ncbi:MAG: hypothetical protein ACE37F_02200 [Nannocystaceae bacterium]|nr:hypothetical protein [bacterium]